jgi:cytochrome c oxidase subunit II
MSEEHLDPVPENAALEDSHEDNAEAASQDPMAPTELPHVDRYEGAWMRISAVVLAIFFISIIVAAFAGGFQLPGVYERVDPTKLYEPGSPFAEPGLRELAPGKYELYIRAQIWSFVPDEVHIPAGSEVTFYATSQDVLHGVKLQDTNINMMILPGQISKLTHRFDTPGTYEFICHEYCGQLHHTMYGRIIVEAEQVAANEGETD